MRKRKIIPLDLDILLDYEALAYWIKADGTKSGTSLTLQTQSFIVLLLLNNVYLLLVS